MTSEGIYDPERIARLAQISCKFHANAAVGDEIDFGIMGDKQMPASYRGAERPGGTIVKIKNEGTERSTLRVQMRGSNRMLDVHPYTVDGGRVWEYAEKTWPNVLARNNPEAVYGKTSSAAGGDDMVSIRRELAEVRTALYRSEAEKKNFESALVDTIAQITGEIEEYHPNPKFSKVFQEEYRGMSKAKKATPNQFFDSDMDSDGE